jgi:hypothetical protein
MTDPTMFDFDKRFEYFKKHLENIKQLPFLSYSQMLANTKFGLYFVFRQSELIYIGKTNREGKKRIREMGSDFRSHTLNRKLLAEELNLFFDDKEQRIAINNKSKKHFIDTGKLSENQFGEFQIKVRSIVKQQLHFKFYDFDETNLAGMECFLIGFLSPTYNN